MTDESAEVKSELIQDAQASREMAKEVEKRLREIVVEVRLTQDLANAVLPAYEATPTDAVPVDRWERERDGWRFLRTSLEASSRALEFTSITVVSGTTSMTNSTMAFAFDVLSSPSPWRPTIERAQSRIHELRSKADLVARITASMRRLQLDTPLTGHQSPLQFLEQASAAYDRPSIGEGDPTSVLIALRSCIDETLNVLIRRKSGQEASKGKRPEKVQMIARACARPGVESVIERLAQEVASLVTSLDEAKQENLSREEIGRRLDRGLNFLNALLISIDEGRLRRV